MTRDERLIMKVSAFMGIVLGSVLLLQARPPAPPTNVRFKAAQAQPGITWQSVPLTSTTPAYNGFLSLRYDSVSQRTLGYLIDHDASTIYSTTMMAFDPTANVWTRLGGTRGGLPPDFKTCNAGALSDVQPWPSDRHPVQQMAIDTTRNRLWLYSGVCGGVDPKDLWYYTLNGDPTLNRWTQVALTTKPFMSSGALVYDYDSDVLVLHGPNSGNFNTTFVLCPADPLTSAQSAAGCTTPFDWVQVFSPNDPSPSRTNYPTSFYDHARRKVIAFLNNGQDLWVYDVPTHAWSQRLPSAFPLDPGPGDSSEQPWVQITSGPNAGRYLYHQTSHSSSSSFAKDWLYDPATDSVTALTSMGTGPQKFLYATWDAVAQRIVAWSYAGPGTPEVWQATLN